MSISCFKAPAQETVTIRSAPGKAPWKEQTRYSKKSQESCNHTHTPRVFIKHGRAGKNRFFYILMYSALWELMQKSYIDHSLSAFVFKTSQSHLRTVVLSCPLAPWEVAKCWSCNSPSRTTNENVNTELTTLFRFAAALDTHPALH